LQLEYAAAQTNVNVDVLSGGQPRFGPNRTGSHRHDEGGAGDVKLRDPETGKYLDMRNPQDAERMAQFTEHAVRAGATGVGAGQGYMGAETLHIGGGRATTWGGAPWIAAAHARGTANPLSPSQVALALSDARTRDAESNRDVMNGALIRSMASEQIKGRASIDIDVAGAKASKDWGEKNLFKETRSKAAPQMPNSTGGEKGDNHSGSSEGPSSNDEE
jgi:hypothetical protein